MLFAIVLSMVIVLAIIAAVLLEIEKFASTTGLLIGAVILAQVFHLVDFVDLVRQHLVASVVYTALYLLVGVLWSFIKWMSFLVSARDTYRELRAQFLRGCKPAGKMPEMPEDFSALFSNWLYNTSQSNLIATDLRADLAQGSRPKAANHKGRIIAWMSFWPLSFIGTLLNDPVRRLFTYLFNRLKSLYQLISDQVFKNDVELK